MVHTVEVENQINAVLLEIRRAESAARGYLLTARTGIPERPRRCRGGDHARRREAARSSTADNPVQVENVEQIAHGGRRRGSTNSRAK